MPSGASKSKKKKSDERGPRHQPSGASKRRKKKLDERDARRRRGQFMEADWRKKYADLGPCPDQTESRFLWLARHAALTLEYTAADPGPPPEQMREQLARLYPQLVKAFEPAKIAEDLRLFKAALDEKVDEEHPRNSVGAPGPPTLC